MVAGSEKIFTQHISQNLQYSSAFKLKRCVNFKDVCCA